MGNRIRYVQGTIENAVVPFCLAGAKCHEPDKTEKHDPYTNLLAQRAFWNSAPNPWTFCEQRTRRLLVHSPGGGGMGRRQRKFTQLRRLEYRAVDERIGDFGLEKRNQIGIRHFDGGAIDADRAQCERQDNLQILKVAPTLNPLLSRPVHRADGHCTRGRCREWRQLGPWFARAAVRNTASLAFLLCCLAGVVSGAGAESPSSKEQQLKARFIYNFLKFVEWPANRFQDTNAPLIIGVTGKGSISAALETTVKGRKINGRELIVKVVDSPETAKATHLLFVAPTEDGRFDTWLPRLAGASVLTVGESDQFGKSGGIIRFMPDGDKLRFEINMDAADQAGLKISAQLQKLAKAVRRKP